MMKYKIEFEFAELLALNKVLNYSKFYCEDSDASEFAHSPIILEVMNKVRETLGEKDNRFIQEKYIEDSDKKKVLDMIKYHLSTIRNEDWNCLERKVKSEIVQILISPFKYKDETLNKLILEEDERRKG